MLKRLSMAFGFVIMIFGLHTLGALRPLEDAIRFVVKPVLRVGYELRQQLVTSATQMADGDSHTQVIALQQEILKLQSELLACQQFRTENEFLRSELDVTTPPAFTGQRILGQVIGENPESLSKFLLIDVGTSDGVSVGLPVVVQGALVGYITEATDNLSSMMLVTDPKSQLPAHVNNSEAQGLIQGTIGLGTLHLTQIGREYPLAPGDLVLTSDLDTQAFRNLIIGTVQTVTTEDRATYQSAQVTPAVDYKQLREVFILLPQ